MMQNQAAFIDHKNIRLSMAGWLFFSGLRLKAINYKFICFLHCFLLNFVLLIIFLSTRSFEWTMIPTMNKPSTAQLAGTTDHLRHWYQLSRLSRLSWLSRHGESNLPNWQQTNIAGREVATISVEFSEQRTAFSPDIVRSLQRLLM